MRQYGWPTFLAQSALDTSKASLRQDAPSGPWDVLSPAEPEPAPLASEPRLMEPGLRRDFSDDFRDLRSQFNQRHKERAGERLPQLLRIIERGDGRELGRFVEVARSNKKVLRDKGCAWCNARIVLQPTQAQVREGFRVAKECELCLAWHCNECGAFNINLGTGNSQARRGSRPTGRPVGIECCQPCCRLFDVLLWNQDTPPKGLPSSSAAIMSAHQDIAAGLTSFVSALVQLEGLVRIEELEVATRRPVPSSVDAPTRVARAQCKNACKEVSAMSLASAAATKKAVETALRRLAEVPCSAMGTPRRDAKLKEEVIKYGKGTLTDYDCRLWAVELRLAAAGASVTERRPPGRTLFGQEDIAEPQAVSRQAQVMSGYPTPPA